MPATKPVYLTSKDLERQLFNVDEPTEDPSDISENDSTITNPPDAGDSVTSHLARHDVTPDLDELAKQNTVAFFVLYVLAQKGRWTVIYAAPNLGKTLLTIALLSKSLSNNPALAKHVVYINADDNLSGVIEKGLVAAEYGFSMLVPSYKDFEIRNLVNDIKRICTEGKAASTIIIIDTLKKAVDLMKKSRLRVFGQVIRTFVGLGGTVITLAHTNKNTGPDGKPIPEGTADIINDADTVYLAYEVKRDDETKTVKLECLKTRGGDASELYVSYSVEPNQNYQQLLSTVEVVDGSLVSNLKPINTSTPDDLIAKAIVECILQGVNTKMRIRDQASEICGASKREVLRVIEQFTGNDAESHKWNFIRGERGRQQFHLLPSQVSRISDFQFPGPPASELCPENLAQNSTNNLEI